MGYNRSVLVRLLFTMAFYADLQSSLVVQIVELFDGI